MSSSRAKPILVRHGDNEYEIEKGMMAKHMAFQTFFSDSLSNQLILDEQYNSDAVQSFLKLTEDSSISPELHFVDTKPANLIHFIQLCNLFRIRILEAAAIRTLHRHGPLSVLESVNACGSFLNSTSFVLIVEPLVYEIIRCNSSDIIKQISLLPWNFLYSIFPTICRNLTPAMLQEFLSYCFENHGFKVWAQNKNIHLSNCSSNSLKGLARHSTSEPVSRCIRDHLSLRCHQQEMLVDVISNRKERNGYFRAGKFIHENSNDSSESSHGLELMTKAATAGNTEACFFMFNMCVNNSDFESAIEYARIMISDGKNECVEAVIDLLNKHPELGNSKGARAIKKSFSSMVESYLSSNKIKREAKARFINFYADHINSDVTVIAENFPRDSSILTITGPFFRKLNPASKNPHVRFFIGLNYYTGMYDVKDIAKGLAIIDSLNLASIDRSIPLEFSADPPLTKRTITFLGNPYSGKSTFAHLLRTGVYDSNLAGTKGACYYEHSIVRGKHSFHFGIWDTCGNRYMSKVVPLYTQNSQYIAIFYSAIEELQIDTVEFWYNVVIQTVHGDHKVTVIVVETHCDQEIDSGTNVIEEWCRRKNLMHVKTSAVNPSGIEEFYNAVTL